MWTAWCLWAVANASPGEVPDRVRVAVEDREPVCLSAVASEGRIRRKDRDLWSEAVAQVRGRANDPEALGAWWEASAPDREGVKPHPAWTVLEGVVRYLRTGRGSEEVVALAEGAPTDACLSLTGAVFAWDLAEDDQARRLISRAWVAGATADVAWLLASRVVTDRELDRRAEIIDKGLRLDPDHGPLRRLRAQVALALGETEGVEEDLGWLRSAGDRALDRRLMEVRYQQGKMDEYLQLALGQGAPVGPAAELDAEDVTLEAFRASLGLSSEDQVLRATLVTDKGEIRCDLLVDEAPVTVAHFVGLATGTQPWTDPVTGRPGEGPLYRDVKFHRVIPGFMIQTGDPTGTGRGGPGYRFHDEIHPSRRMSRAGLLAMANAGPGTNGSQFFVTEDAAEHLTGRHAVFGECVDLGVVKEITAVPRDGQDAPAQPVLLRSVEIEVIGR